MLLRNIVDFGFDFDGVEMVSEKNRKQVLPVFDKRRQEWIFPPLPGREMPDTAAEWTWRLEKNRQKKLAKRQAIQAWWLLGAGISVEAIRFAEKILAQKAGGYWGEKLPDEEDICRGGLDSQGHYGPDTNFVRAAFFAAGCKDWGKFAAQLRLHRLAQKGETEEEFRNFHRGCTWFVQHSKGDQMVDMRHWSRKAVACLGRLSGALRWAAISGLQEPVGRLSAEKPKSYCYQDCDKMYHIPGKIRVRDLNWEAVAACQKARTVRARWAHAPKRALWFEIQGCDRPAGLPKEAMPGMFSAKLYEELCKIAGAEPYNGPDHYQGIRKPAYRLASLYKSLQPVQKLAGGELTSMVIHNLGQFDPSQGFDKKLWGDLALRYGVEVFQLAGRWTGLQQLEEFPKSLGQLRLAAAKMLYNAAPGEEAIAEAAAMGHLDEEGFKAYVQWFRQRKLKTSEAIPHVFVGGEAVGVPGMHIEQLSAHSPLAPLAGVYTNCCQHPRGAGSDCARSVVEDAKSAIWAIWYKGKIIAQSFVWRSEDLLVLDSIEALANTYAEGIVKLLVAACNQAKGRFSICGVACSLTNYGITGECRDALSLGEEVVLSKCPASYSDTGYGAKLINTEVAP